ncbi:MAG: WG repeat-containing protein [Candidatus Sericytochromatia bacterium]
MFNSANSEEINQLYPFKVPNYEKYGYINKVGRTIFTPEFDQAFNLKNGIYVFRKSNLYGFINQQGKLIEPIFTEIRGVGENIICARISNKWSYYDLDGKQLFNNFYDDAYLFNNGLARVFNNKRYGYIDKNGYQVIRTIYDYADNFYDGYAYATFENKDNTVINTQGKVVITTKKDHIYNFYEGIAVYAGENNRYGYVTKDLKKTKAIYQFADNFKNGYARVKIDNKWGIIDKNYNYVINPIYDYINNFSEDYALFLKNRKSGFVNIKGKELGKYFDSALSFSEGLAPVSVDNIWGYINSFGDFVIKQRFDKAEQFNNGLAKVNNNSYIDKSGNIIWSESEYADKNESRISIDKNKYNLPIGKNVCVNYWGENLGFCGEITSVLDNKYRIKLNYLNCNSDRCSGACSDNIIEVVSNTKKVEKLIEEGKFSVEVYKDCISSY